MNKPRRCWLGIDPGTSGAIACISANDITEVMMLPIAGKQLDLLTIANWIYERTMELGKTPVVCIEKVHAIPAIKGKGGMSSIASFTFGFSTGALYGIVTTMGLPLMEVTPQAWKKEILAGTAKDKPAAIDYCTRAYPTVSLLPTPRSRKPNPNMADALCIATYCRVKYHDFR